MRRLHILMRVSLIVLCLALSGFAGQGDWILSLKDCGRFPMLQQQYGLGVKAVLQNGPGPRGVYLVSMQGIPSGLQSLIANALKTSSFVQSVEPDSALSLPEVAAHPQNGHTFPSLVTGGSSTSTCAAAYSGSGKLPPPSYYLNQPAVCLVNLPEAQEKHGRGNGVEVAVIDTWVDYRHPALFQSIDLGHSRSFLTNPNGIPLTQETSPMVDQETSPMVDQETSPMVDSRNPAFAGHGTGVAGLVHLTAPNAQIAVLQAFDARTGTANLSAIVAAINYAVHNAKVDVINMSFTVPPGTPNIQSLTDALKDAESAGVILMASVPDNAPGFNSTLPASYPGVTSAACTDSNDKPCSFSGRVSGVTIYAPGLYVMSPYPGGRYALYSGTSFSVAWASGTGALLSKSLPTTPFTSALAAQEITSNSDWVSGGIPRLDVSKTVK